MIPAKLYATRRVALITCLVFMALWGLPTAAQVKVTTVAGGYVGDGQPATSAAVQFPRFTAMDRAGNLYVTDRPDHRVRKVDAVGVISTLAGTGIAGYSGDHGPANAANIYFPAGIVVDSKGNVIFCDTGNNRIRKVSRTGMIITIAGTGVAGYSGDGGSARSAQINFPYGLAVDSADNLFFADVGNQRIRKIDNSGIIHTVAGNGTAGFSGDGGPATSASLKDAYGVFADSTGDLYIADTDNLRVRKVDTTGTITTVAGSGLSGCTGDGGPATSARIGRNDYVAIHGGNLWLSQGGCDLVRVVNLHNQVINTVAGSLTSWGFGGFDGNGHTALESVFAGEGGLVWDKTGNLLIVDSANVQVRKIDSTTHIVTAFVGGYLGDGKAGTKADLNAPESVAFDPTGNMYIAENFGSRVRKLSPNGKIKTFAGTGISGKSGDGGPATSATLLGPVSVAADTHGNVFIADVGGTVIRKVDASGTINTLTLQNSEIFFLVSLATDSAGNLYGADPGACVIWKIDPAGVVTDVAGVPFQCGYISDGGSATSTFLSSPSGVALDNMGNLFIGDADNNRVRKVDTKGIITTVAGDGTCGFFGDGGAATSAQLCFPTEVAADAHGNVYIADYFNLRIRIVDGTGTIDTLAGTGNSGYNGDGLPGTQTNLDSPIDVAVSPSGVVFVDDDFQNRVRKIH